MKICPKCQTSHTKPGAYCSRSCANSRGPRSEDFKNKVRLKLKGRRSPRKGTGKIKKNTFSKITGKENYSDCWSDPRRARFFKKVSVWFNIPLQTPDTSNEFEKLKQHISELYHKKQMSSLEIKKELNIPLPNGHMPAFLKQMGVKRRTLSESSVVAISTGRMTPPGNNKAYKCGWHIDFEGISHYYRSSYEQIFYEKLDEKRISYQTESKRLPYYDSVLQKQRIAIPDVIIRNNVIFEIKSNYRFKVDRQNMIDKFVSYKKQGYRALLVIDGKIWWRVPESN